MIQIDKPMPEGCDVCPFMYDYIQCKALPEDCIDDEAFYEDEFDWTKRPEWCPLKEQKAVKPEVEVLNEIDRLYKCPRCHKHFFYEKQKYCDQCGQAVKWE